MPGKIATNPPKPAPFALLGRARTFSAWTVFHVFHPVGRTGAFPLLSARVCTRRAPVPNISEIERTFAAASGLAEITALLPRTARAIVHRQTEKDPGKTGGR